MGVTGKTVRNRLTPLRSVLDDAVNDELLDSNPLDRIALGKLIKQTATKSNYEVDPFDMDEVAALYQGGAGRRAAPDPVLVRGGITPRRNSGGGMVERGLGAWARAHRRQHRDGYG